MSKEEIEGYKKEQEQINNSGFGRWGWFAMLEKLATWMGGSFDKAEEMNYILALNLLSYWKEKEAEEARIKKEIMKKNKF